MRGKELLISSTSKMGIDLSEKQIDQFLCYKDMLIEWNEKMNLTAITDEDEIMIKHFADSVSALSFIKDKEASVIDVGTGAGFPGVPLKIAQPSLKVTLLDSLNKRIGFLNELKEKLCLSDIECIHSRAEDGGQNSELRENFDYCVSRAVARISVLSEYCLPFVKVGGYFISLKGPEVEAEIEEGKNAIKKLGGRIVKVENIEVPESDLKHCVVIIKKVSPTPKQYPRKAGTASKKPL